MGIAHDFNNLLTPVLYHAESLMETAEEERRQDVFNSANEISFAAKMARDIVGKILALARTPDPSGAEVIDIRSG